MVCGVDNRVGWGDDHSNRFTHPNEDSPRSWITGIRTIDGNASGAVSDADAAKRRGKFRENVVNTEYECPQPFFAVNLSVNAPKIAVYNVNVD